MVEESSISKAELKNVSSTTTEPSSIREIDGLVVLGMSQDDLDFYEGFSPQMRSRLNRKVCFGAAPARTHGSTGVSSATTRPGS
jgi:hypothetical protein